MDVRREWSMACNTSTTSARWKLAWEAKNGLGCLKISQHHILPEHVSFVTFHVLSRVRTDFATGRPSSVALEGSYLVDSKIVCIKKATKKNAFCPPSSLLKVQKCAGLSPCGWPAKASGHRRANRLLAEGSPQPPKSVCVCQRGRCLVLCQGRPLLPKGVF